MSEPFFKESDCELKQWTKCDYTITASDHFISLTKANSILKQRGMVVYGTTVNDEWGYCTEQHEADTHRALLINIEPLERDSAESLLNKIVEEFGAAYLSGPHDIAPRLRLLIDRARKLKGGEK